MSGAGVMRTDTPQAPSAALAKRLKPSAVRCDSEAREIDSLRITAYNCSGEGLTSSEASRRVVTTVGRVKITGVAGILSTVQLESRLALHRIRSN
jgi:hypothetical protein